MSGWKSVFQKLTFPKQRRYERNSDIAMAAEFGLDANFTSAAVKDISTGGVYLTTEKRLPTNELITLTLREEGHADNTAEHQFSIHARVVRQGKDGIGLSFVLPPGLDTNLWDVLVRNITSLDRSEEISTMFRTLRVILFLCRVCQSGAEEPIHLLGGGLASDRVETLVKIALDAEKQLAGQADFEGRRADPKVVTTILREGSWAPDEHMIALWSGLLASSCMVDEPKEADEAFVNLLTQIAPGSLKTLTYACEQAMHRAAGGANASPSSVVATPEELTELTGLSDVTRISAVVTHLFDLGLLEKVPYFRSSGYLDGLDITPTRLGLEFYQRCRGVRAAA